MKALVVPYRVQAAKTQRKSVPVWLANLFSDKEGDPHSPRDGAWWAHMLWFMPAAPRDQLRAHLQRYAPDLYQDRGMRFLHAIFLPTQRPARRERGSTGRSGCP
jgi:fatty-acid desaturase